MGLYLIRLFVNLIATFISFLIFVQQVYAVDNTRSLKQLGAEFSEVLKYADAEMWDEATRRVDALNSSVAYDILQWLKLRAGIENFAEYESFLLINDDWPGMALLRSQGEQAINSSIKTSRILNYFLDQEPLTANGSIKFAQSLLVNNELKKAQIVIKKSWLEHSYSTDDLKQVIKLFGKFLNPYHAQRIDNLLWSGRLRQAEEMHLLVPRDIRLLSEARIALKRLSPGVDILISQIPKHLQANPGLIFDRFSYRQKKNLHEGAEQILLDISKDTNALGKPSFWLKGRSAYARRALLRKEFEKAYIIASNHSVDLSATDISKDALELEWLSGFIAFEFFQEYETALEHFERFFKFVVNPINRAKAAYWIGRTYEKLFEKDRMMAAYAVGAKYQTTFYGQLSAERGGVPIDSTIISNYVRYEWESAEFMEDSTVKSAILLYYSGRSVLADRFFNHTSEKLNLTDKLKLSQLVHDLGLKASGLSIAKTAGQAGIFCPDFMFPNIDQGLVVDKHLEALVASVIRQESGFFSYTKSSAGAIGLMQVMPRTAAAMAKKLGLSFSDERLLKDKNYNVKIGTYFLETLLKKFDNSRVLSIAAYNAGPYRIKEWINEFGDPRAVGVDPLIWIEMIPFLETRNYVKRVLEADWVYRGKVRGELPRLELGRQSFGHKF